MVMYECQPCNYISKYKKDYNKHLKTKKHEKNSKETGGKPHFQHIPTHFSHFQHISPQFVCEFCKKTYSRIDSLNRHKKGYCKAKHDVPQTFEEKNAESMLVEAHNNEIKALREEMNIQRNHLMKQIELLLTKVGTTNVTNNITNNIQLNNYGNEDLSHITKTLKTEMLKIPYSMIPKMIEEVHFNGEKPENKNIMIVNKKDKFIKIFDEGKWIYKDKNETLEDLIDGKYFILDEHYSLHGSAELSEVQKECYENFRDKYDENDDQLKCVLKKQTELALLNNRNELTSFIKEIPPNK